jgi:4-amino-4-deoxy-L-arabinose transferase-like glycosyltransferase
LAIYERPSLPVDSARPRSRTAVVVPLALFLAALLPRLSPLGRYVTPDEPVWLYRSIGFRQALLSADWANTLQSGHPGVLITWLGALGIQLKLLVDPSAQAHLDWLAALPWLRPENGQAIQQLSPFLTPARLVVAVAASLGIVLIWRLARPRLGAAVALLGCLLLALDPFSAGLSSILHLDGLLATLMLLALMPLLPEAQGGRLPRTTVLLMALSGLFTGLAVLTKTPALFLLFFIPPVHLWTHWRAGTWRQGVFGLVSWAATAGLTVLLLLPALWLGPGAVLGQVQALSGRLVEAAARPNFFLGRPTLDPGPIYYPLVLIYRLSPVVFLGLLGLAAIPIARLRGRSGPVVPANALWLLACSLVFTVVLSLAATKHQRYLIPALMPLILVAAAALVGWARHFSANGERSPAPAVLALAGLLQLAFLFAYAPFPLTAYNWLAGGPVVARQLVPADWGESASLAARRAATLPGADRRTLFTANVPSTAPFYPGRVVRLTATELRRIQPGDLVLLSAQELQWLDSGGETAELIASVPKGALVNTLDWARGLEARLYTGLQPSDFGLAAVESRSFEVSFDQAVSLLSAGAAAASWPDSVTVLATWQVSAPEAHTLQLALVDDEGYAWSSLETPLLDEADRPPPFWASGSSGELLYGLPVPADLAPGRYSLQATLFDDQGGRMGVFGREGRFKGVVAILADLAIAPPSAQPEIRPPISLEGHPLEVVGRGALPATIDSGTRLVVDLWWRNWPETPPGAGLVLNLGPIPVSASLDANGWLAHQVYHLRPGWTVPMDLPAGSLELSLMLVDEGGRPLWSGPLALGEVTVEAVERQFDLPPGLEPLGLALGEVVLLQQAAAAAEGGDLVVEVIWQGATPDGVSYSAFVHLLDQGGAIVSQVDRPPEPPTSTWVGGQVVGESYRLQLPQSGVYTVALGLYDPATGDRLPMSTVDGDRLPTDSYTIELRIP